MDEVFLKVCEQIIAKSTFSSKTILNYSFKHHEDEEAKVELKIFTKEEEFQFVLSSNENTFKSNSDLYGSSPMNTDYNSVLVSVKDVIVTGFNEAKFGELDFAHLKIILETLAYDYSKSIKRSLLTTPHLKSQTFDPNAYRQCFTDILFLITEHEDVYKIDANVLYEGIKELLRSSDAVFDSNKEYVYVGSGGILQKKLYFRNAADVSDCKIITIGSEKDSALVYDVLLTIFCFSDQKLRQDHFHELLDYFYDILQNNLSEAGLDLTKILPLRIYQEQINLFMPYVKLEVVKQYYQRYIEASKEYQQEILNSDITKKYKNLLWTSTIELNETVLYPKLAREDCYNIIRRVVGSSYYIFLNYKLVSLEQRKGFLGDYYKLKINIRYEDEDRQLNLFAKYLPTTSDLAKQLATNSFRKEEFYYEQFVPELIDLGLKDICDFLPKCYFSRTNDVLILEDLSTMGYSSISVTEPFSYDTVRIILKQLAKMHACSLLYEEIMSDKTENIIRLDSKYGTYIEEMPFKLIGDPDVIQANACARDAIFKMYELFPDILKELTLEEFKNKSKVVFELFFEKVKKSDKYRNVFCQGDCWSSNILFKINADKILEDCCIIDYQFSRYCPPGNDIFYLIYMVTDRETRTKYMSRFIDEYYLELSSIFEKYNFDLSKIYPYETFLDSCKYMRSQGLCQAAIVLQMVLYPEEKMMAILSDEKVSTRVFCEDRTVFLEEVQIDGPYRHRMKGIIEDLYEICLNDDL